MNALIRQTAIFTKWIYFISVDIMNIKQIIGVLALIIIPIALVFIIQKSMQVDYGRGIGQSTIKENERKPGRLSPEEKILNKKPQEEITSEQRPKVVVAIPLVKEDNKSGQKNSTEEQGKKEEEKYVSIAKLIPKETYSYKYSPSKSSELVASIPKASTAEKTKAENSTQSSSPQPEGGQQIIRDIKTEFLGEKLVITILADSPIKDYKNFSLSSPPRYVIDLYGRWSIPETFRPIKPNSQVKGIRFGLYPDKLRFVLDLENDLPFEPTIILSSTGMKTTDSH